IADINDLGGSIKGWSDSEMRKHDFADILRDNPMGQTITMTPLALVREAAK
ncbi:MAG TPA: F420-0--gamma-glutamyl ligase, partial [Firmicutes bacterium]|nr:F420-0--gamma-glutamyl ligase [Bacillota bacterium]